MAAGAIIGGIIGGVVGAFGTAYGIRDQQKAMKEAYLKQMETLLLNYNYNQQALDEEQRFTLESAKNELFNITLNGIQNNSAVFAAQAETGHEGRTGQQVARAITGQVERRRTGVIAGYEQDIYQIKRERDNLYIQTKRTVDQAEENFNEMQASDFENVFSVFQGSVKGSMIGAAIGSGIGGGFAAMAGGGSAAAGGASAAAGSGSISLAGIGSSGALSTGAAGASSAGSIALSAGSSGSAWGSFLGGFNNAYSQFSQYNNMFSSMNSLMNMFNQNGKGYGRYNFIY